MESGFHVAPVSVLTTICVPLFAGWNGLRRGKSAENVVPTTQMFPEASTAMLRMESLPEPPTAVVFNTLWVNPGSSKAAT